MASRSLAQRVESDVLNPRLHSVPQLALPPPNTDMIDDDPPKFWVLPGKNGGIAHGRWYANHIFRMPAIRSPLPEHVASSARIVSTTDAQSALDVARTYGSSTKFRGGVTHKSTGVAIGRDVRRPHETYPSSPDYSSEDDTQEEPPPCMPPEAPANLLAMGSTFTRDMANAAIRARRLE